MEVPTICGFLSFEDLFILGEGGGGMEGHHACVNVHGSQKRELDLSELKLQLAVRWLSCPNSGPLEKQRTHLTTEPPLQSPQLLRCSLDPEAKGRGGFGVHVCL